jgi:glutathione S-transferase
MQIEEASAAWLPPSCFSATQEQREAAKRSITAALSRLNGQLEKKNNLLGGTTTLADIALASAVLPLYQEILGQAAQAEHGHVTAWLSEQLKLQQFAAILGEDSFSL